MMERFKRSGSSGQSRKIKDWTREALNLSDEYSILVTELQCSEPDCPPIETVIAVLGPRGMKYQQKVHFVVPNSICLSRRLPKRKCGPLG